MTRKILIGAIAVFLLMTALFAGCQKQEEITSVEINGTEYPLDTEVLDFQMSENVDIDAIMRFKNLRHLNLQFTDVTQEDIAKLQSALPNCEIVYSIYIEGQPYRNDSTGLNFFQVEISDMDTFKNSLSLFTQPMLVHMDAQYISAEDYKMLKEEFPHNVFSIEVVFNDILFFPEERNIDLSTLEKIDFDELMNTLEYFDQVESIDFGHISLSQEQMNMLMDAYPDAQFTWNVDLLGQNITPDISEIDLSNIIIEDYDGFKSTLKYLPNVNYIDMCDCGLSNEQMEGLTIAYPDKKFVWKINIGYWELRTDVKAFSTGKKKDFAGGTYLGGGNRLQNDQAQLLKYCTDLVALDVGHQADIVDFSFLEYMPDMQYLIVALGNMEDLSVLTHMEHLIYLEVFSTDVEDLSPLLELPNLRHLNISNTKVDTTDILVKMTDLERLWIVLTPLTKAQRQELYEALPDTQIVHYTMGPTAGGWRSESAQVYIDMQNLFELPCLFSE